MVSSDIPKCRPKSLKRLLHNFKEALPKNGRGKTGRLSPLANEYSIRVPEPPPPRQRTSEAEIIAHCRAKLAGFKVPKKVVFEELPKTATGKIQKFVLRDQAKGFHVD